MKSWLRRVGYFLIILVWSLIMVFPISAFVLSTRGQINLGQNPKRHVRLFMVQEENSHGVGVEWARRSRNYPDCARTSIRYFLWSGDATEPVSFCQCFDPISGAVLPSETGGCLR